MGKNGPERAFQNARLKKQQKAEVAQLFERAVALHKTGLLPDAKAVYRQLLQLAPNHFDALYLLGMSEFHARSFHEAETLLTKAVGAEPRSAEAHMHRGVVLSALQRFEEAGASYQRAIALKPGYAVALNNLGTVCLSLGRFDEAVGHYDAALTIKNDFADAHYNRGLALSQLKQDDEALASFDRALAVRQRYPEAWNSRGSALRALERNGEALESYDAALALNPEFAEALNNRGNALIAMERPAEALESYDKALAVVPGFAEALNGRGGALTRLRDYDNAIACFQRALAIRPDYAEAHANRAFAWLELMRPDAALADFDCALAIAPGYAEAWAGRANALLQAKRGSEALSSCQRALAIDPNSYRAHSLLGQCQAKLGQVDEAIASFEAALAIRPDFADAISNRIFALDFAPGADFAMHRDARRAWWEQIGSKFAAPAAHANTRDPNRRLVLGYVSSDFRAHSAASAFKQVLRHHEKASFETVYYSCSAIQDHVTEEFHGMADHWRDASQWSDDRLAGQIREDAIDILIDLSGHTNGHRLGVFARKPAPILVHGWGHGTPPGLPVMDYVFSDPVAIPRQARHLFCETICDLPCVATVEPLPPEVPHAEAPAIANGFVTFGVFNRTSKISDAAAALWSRILARLPDTRLLIKDSALDDPAVGENLLARFARHGVPAERIRLLGSSPRADHLAALNAVDICLDPFPQNGGISTWESLQMGVPVIAKLGNTLPSRVAGAILSAAGLRDWVAENEADYFDIAVARASRVGDLGTLRRALPGRIAASPAGNATLYADAVATAYRRMWRAWCVREAE